MLAMTQHTHSQGNTHTRAHRHAHRYLSLLFALFLWFLSRLRCWSFRFLYLFSSLYVSGLGFLLQSKHRAP